MCNVFAKCNKKEESDSLKSLKQTTRINDLLDSINRELEEINGANSKISTRTLCDDIKYLRSPERGEAPIVSYKKDGRSYYRHRDPNFKLFNQGLNATEVQQIKGFYHKA